MRELPAPQRWRRSHLAPIGPNVPVHEALVQRLLFMPPDQVVLTGRGGPITARELLDRSLGLARALVADGVQPAEIVAIQCDRGGESLVARLAVNLAGGAWLPLDPQHPQRRRGRLSELAGARRIVLGAGQTAPIETLATIDVTALEMATDATALPAIEPEDPACALCTSGSTGAAKIALNSHRGWVNLLQGWAEVPGLRAGETMLAVASPNFDMSVIELFLPLWCGAVVHAVSEELVADPIALALEAEDCEATLVLATPTVMSLLLQGGWQPPMGARAVCGGEPLQAELVAALLDRSVAVWNGYGVTEAAACATIATLGRGDPITIGVPSPGCGAWVVGSDGWPKAAGEEGELWISGAGVGLGYVGLPELNEERFVAVPWLDGGRAYRTGDLAVCRHDGRLQLCGRVDDQVKIRGQRVQPDEVAERLAAVSGIADVAVVAIGSGADKALHGFVRGDVAERVAHRWLRALAEQLPSAWVPRRLTALAQWPQLSNGKVDRAALRERATAQEAGVFGQFGGGGDAGTGHPTDGAAADAFAIADVLATVLARPFGIEDDFVALGGDSLAAMRACALLEGRLQRRLRAADVLRGRRASAIAALLRRDGDGWAENEDLDGSEGPATASQRGMWLAEQLAPGGLQQVTLLKLSVDPVPTLAVLQRAAQAVALAQPALRTALRNTDRGQLQAARPAAITVTRLEAPVSADSAWLRRPFDLAAGAVWRVATGSDGQREVVWVAVHHVAFDAHSATLLVDALARACAGRPLQAQALARAEPPDKAAVAARASTLSSALWRVPLPADAGEPPSAEACIATGALSAELAAALAVFRRAAGCTSLQALSATLAAWLHVRTGVDHVALGTMVADRDDPRKARKIGFLARPTPFRCRPRPTAGLAVLSAQVRRSLVDAMAAQRVPADALAAALQRRPDERQQPLFNICITAVEAPAPVAMDDRRWSATEVPLPASPYDLALELVQDQGSIRWLARARRCVWRPAQLDAAIADWLALTEQLLRDPDKPLGQVAWHEAERAANGVASVATVVNGQVLRAGLCSGDAPITAQPRWDRAVPVSRLPLDEGGNLRPSWALTRLGVTRSELVRAETIAPGVRLMARPTATPRWLPRAADAGTPQVPPATVRSSGATSTGASRLDGGPLAASTDGPTTVVEALRRAADEGAMIRWHGDDAWKASAAELLAAAERAAIALAAAADDYAPEAPVLLHVRAGGDFFVGLWAALLAGRPVAPLLPSAQDDAAGNPRLRGALQTLRPAVVIADDASAPALRGYRVLVPGESPRQHPVGALESRPSPAEDEAALLLLTSGSSGAVKAAVHDHRSLLAHAASLASALRLDGDDRWLNWLPLDHVGGVVMCHLLPIVLAADQHHLPPDAVLASPRRWLRALSESEATFSWAPSFAFEAAAEDAANADERWDLRHVRTIINGGEAVRGAALERFVRIAARHGLAADAVKPAWGMSETASATIVCHGLNDDCAALTPVPVGRPIPGMTVELRGPDGAPVPSGAEGTLWVRGPMLFRGYWGMPERTAAALRADGWLCTGDRARIVSGRVQILGRSDDTLVVRGANIAADVLEAAAAGALPWQDGAVAVCALDDRPDKPPGIGLFVELPESLSRDAVHARATGLGTADEAESTWAAKIAAAVAARAGEQPAQVLALRNGSIPRTGIGKLQRRPLQQAWRAGAFDFRPDRGQAPWNPSAFTEERLLRLVWRRAPTSAPARVDAVSEGDAGPGKVVWIDGALDPLRTARSDGPLVIAWRVLDPLPPRGDPAQWAARAAGFARRCAQLAALAERRSGPTELVCFGHEHDAAAAAILASLRHERPRLSARWVTLDDRCDDAMADELAAAAAPALGTAWRAGQRWQLGLARARPSSWAAATWLQRGAVVIIGGLGGIGPHVAGALLQRFAADILLVGREPEQTFAPERLQTWRSMQALAAAAGRRARYAAADIGARGALEQALTRFESEGTAQVSAVFHLAGEAPSGTLGEAEDPGFSRVATARVAGSEAVVAAVLARPGCAMIDFGSVHGVLGAAGLAAYAAGSAAGRAACERARQGGHAAWHIAWSAWRGVGMSRGLTARSDDPWGRLALHPDEALAQLWAALQSPPGDLLAGVDAASPQLASLLTHGPCAAQIAAVGPRNEVQALREALSTWPWAGAAGLAADTPRRAAAPIAGRWQDRVAEAWAEALPAPVHDSDVGFFDAGGDSLRMARLQRHYELTWGLTVPLLDLFKASTIGQQAALLKAMTRGDEQAAASAPSALTAPPTSESARRAPERQRDPPTPERAGVAIVGIAARMPGADDTDGFWQDIVDARYCGRRFSAAELEAAGPPERDDPAFVPVRAPLRGALEFDASFFSMSAAEAARTDPQHRVLLQTAWHALEDAGCDPARFGGPIGVFVGCSASDYGRAPGGGTVGADSVARSVAIDRDFLATRVAYKLDLTGPALDIQTACSTSLVAVQLAAQSLLAGQCDAALAGGASIAAQAVGGHVHAPGGVTSADGHCRPFSDDADGCFGGDGCAVVLLKRLADATRDGDRIYAVIRGAAVNNDGKEKVGFTAPGLRGQVAVIRAALAQAEIAPQTIGLVEAHGTATPIGDPIEVAALTEAWASSPDGGAGWCALGSVKGNIGHLNAAAGVAGLVKAALAVHRGVVPPSWGMRAPNPALALPSSPFYVPTAAAVWPAARHPRRAAVSSFGIGGTNAHVLLEQAPAIDSAAAPTEGPWHLCISGHDHEAARRAATALAARLREDAALELRDVAATLARRPLRAARLAVTAATTSEAIAALTETGHPRRFAGSDGGGRPALLVCAGQGGQAAGIAQARRGHDPIFARHFDEALTLFEQLLGRPLRPLVDAVGERRAAADELLLDESLAAPVNFALGVAMGRAWREHGGAIDALLGHSLGELVAACVGGVMTLAEGAQLVVARSEAFAALPAGGGEIVLAPAKTVRPLLGPNHYLSVDNGPAGCLVSAAEADLEALCGLLDAHGLAHRRLAVRVPPHCPLLAPMRRPLRDLVATFALHPPQVATWSSRLGGALDAVTATDPDHWAAISVEAVQFGRAAADALTTLKPAVVEIGPRRSVAALVDAIQPGVPVVPSLLQNTETAAGPSWPQSLPAMRWAAGLADTPAMIGRVVSLPLYPFDRTVHALAATPTASIEAGRSEQQHAHKPRPNLAQAYESPENPAESQVAAICEQLLGVAPIGRHDNLLELGADSLITLRITSRIRSDLGVQVQPAAAFAGMTVAAIAASFPHQDLSSSANETVDSAAPCLVPLRSTGSRRPVFLIHPAAGVIFPYIELARALPPDQPVYALQAQGLDGLSEPDPDVPAMAKRYIAAIASVQPDGPCDLVGYSFGCYIALEVALQLQQQGRPAGFLGLLDESAPLDGHRPTWAMMSRLLLGRAGRTFYHHLHDYLYLAQDPDDAPARRRRTGLRARLRDSGTRRWQRFLQRSAMAALLPEDSHRVALDQPAMSPMFRLFRQHVSLTFSYSPGARWTGEATLFLSDWTTDRPAWVQRDDDPTFGWRQLIEGHVAIERVPGDHLGMIRKPHVLVLADKLNRALTASQVTGS